jgi:serine/threonine-protein kinase
MDRVDLLAGRYRLLDRLGAGGMSVVWLGYDEVLGRDVAVKVLNEGCASDAWSRGLIRAEARVAASLSHPHLVNVHDYGEQVLPGGSRVSFLVMELAEGPSLADQLLVGRLPWHVAVRVCAEVAAGLAAMHEQGLVHRDVKPANVVLTRAGAKVVDFGIAAVAGDRADASRDGLVLGTPAYLAPERVVGGVVTPATDVYALGLLLYRSLTGTMPWPAATVTGMIRAHCFVEPAPMPAVVGLPPQVSRLCCRCLSKDPASRPGSDDVARLLAAVADEASTSPVRRPAVAGTRARRVGAVAAVVTVLAGGLLTASQPGRRDSPAVAAAVAARTAEFGRPAAGCAVRYQMQRDADGVFAVDLTVTNTARRRVSGATLSFEFPGQQRVARADGWTQSGRVVRSPAGAVALASQASVTLHLTGTHPHDNPLPTRFVLDGASCAAQVSGVRSTAEAATPGGGSNGSAAVPPPGPAQAAPGGGVTADGGGAATGQGKNNGKRNGKAKGNGKRK